MQKNVQRLIIIGGILVLSLVVTPTAGQQADRPQMTPQLALAVLTWSEAGLVTRSETEDGVAWSDDADMRGIHAVLLAGAERHGMRYLSYAAAYARRLIGRQGTISRPWLWELRPDGRQPTQWPTEVWVSRASGAVRTAHAPWAVYRQRWLDTYARAGEVSALTLDTWHEWGVCSEPPDDWGGSVDRERAARLGLIRLECEGTRNDFYLRPSTVAQRD
jgi:hypothetical protein